MSIINEHPVEKQQQLWYKSHYICADKEDTSMRERMFCLLVFQTVTALDIERVVVDWN